MFSLTELASYFSFKMSEKSVSLFSSSVSFFCQNVFEVQAKYNDKIHQAELSGQVLA